MELIFVSEFYWPEIGGLERSTERLAVELARRGHTVKVVTRHLGGTKQAEWRYGVRILRFVDGDEPFTAPVFGDPSFDGADVICIFGVGHDPAARWWGPILSSKRRRHTIRLLKVGTDGDITSKGIPAHTYRRLDGVLCQTPAIALEASSVGVPQDACYPIRNGLDVRRWTESMPSRQQARSALGIDPNAFVVLGLGRFTRRKRFQDIIAMYSVLRSGQLGGNIQLVLHGSDFGQDDGVEASVRELAANMEPLCHFIPPTVGAQVSLAASDLLVTMSEREGAPNIFIEAFASGVPVVATELPGHRVYVDSRLKGSLVPIGGFRDAAGAVESILTDPEYFSRMKAAVSRDAWRFDIGTTVTDYLAAFDSAHARRIDAI